VCKQKRKSDFVAPLEVIAHKATYPVRESECPIASDQRRSWLPIGWSWSY